MPKSGAEGRRWKETDWQWCMRFRLTGPWWEMFRVIKRDFKTTVIASIGDLVNTELYFRICNSWQWLFLLLYFYMAAEMMNVVENVKIGKEKLFYPPKIIYHTLLHLICILKTGDMFCLVKFTQWLAWCHWLLFSNWQNGVDTYSE